MSKSAKKGGIAKGDTHKDPSGGISGVIEQSNTPIKFEHNEIILNRKNSEDPTLLEFEGEEMTTCEIASKLNSRNGNGVEIDCDSVFIENDSFEYGGKLGVTSNKDIIDALKILGELELAEALSLLDDDNDKKEHRKASVKEIYNYISGMNPTSSTVSSIGTFVTNMNQQVADNIVSEVLSALPKDSLAYKIASNNSDFFTEKQLWVISYELEKNNTFSEKVASFYDEIYMKEDLKAKRSKEKLKLNKEGSKDVLAHIKNSGRKLGDYYKWLNTSGNKYRKEHFSKKYTNESANEFLKSSNTFGKGGITDSEIFTRKLYSVEYHTDTSSDEGLYPTDDYEKALDFFNSVSAGDYSDYEFYVALVEEIGKYRFVHELDEDESIEDYPLDDFYDDESVYELIDDFERDNLQVRTIQPVNHDSDELLQEVERWVYDKYGKIKYNDIDVYAEDEEDSIGCIQLRVSNHTENIRNIDRFGNCDYYISVVISNSDPTEDRFWSNRFERRSNEVELKFDGDNNLDEVISEIEYAIEDGKDFILDKKGY